MSKVAAPLLHTPELPLHHQNTPKIWIPWGQTTCRPFSVAACTDKMLRPWLNKPSSRLQPQARPEPSTVCSCPPPSLLSRDKHSTDGEAGGRKEDTGRKANSYFTTQASQLLAVKNVVEQNFSFCKPKSRSYLMLVACSDMEVNWRQKIWESARQIRALLSLKVHPWQRTGMNL